MYYHRFSGLRSCCIISSLPGLVIFIFSIVSPSSPISLFFSSPLLPLYFRPFSSLPQGARLLDLSKARGHRLLSHCYRFHFFLPLSPSLSSFFLDLFSRLVLCIIASPAGVYMASSIALVAAGMILVYMYYYDCYLLDSWSSGCRAESGVYHIFLVFTLCGNIVPRYKLMICPQVAQARR
jgi:hypothetical protein